LIIKKNHLTTGSAILALALLSGCSSSSDNSTPASDQANNLELNVQDDDDDDVAPVLVTPDDDTETVAPDDTETVTPDDDAETVTPDDDAETVTPDDDAETVTPDDDAEVTTPDDDDEQNVITEPVPEPINPTGIISSVAVGTTQGQFFAGSPPEATGAITLNPITEDELPTRIISGGSTQIPVTANAPFSTVYIVSDDEGYFVVNLPAETTEADVIVSYSTLQLDGDEAQINAQVQSAGGDVSEEQSLAVTSLIVGTGDLQVSVSWDTLSDVDLYLTEPNGDIIDFFFDTSAAGGELDLDSNAACFLDGINNENITYENVVPPTGEYIVELDYYSACDVTGPTNYVVTIRINNQVETFQGSFVPGGDTFARITTFEIR